MNFKPVLEYRLLDCLILAERDIKEVIKVGLRRIFNVDYPI